MQETALADSWEQAQLEYTKKIRTAAWNSYKQIPGYAPEDVEQELLVVLWESIVLYDPNKGASFNTFFWMRAKQKIGMLIRKWTQMKKRKADLVSLDVEAVAAVVDGILNASSAEDAALLNMEIRDRLTKERQRQQKSA